MPCTHAKLAGKASPRRVEASSGFEVRFPFFFFFALNLSNVMHVLHCTLYHASWVIVMHSHKMYSAHFEYDYHLVSSILHPESTQ